MSFTSFLLKVRSNFMYLPTLYGGIAFILALLSSKAESTLLKSESVYQLLPGAFLSDISLARTILSTISASLLTITTITFSTILVVLTTYLSNFSPRTLQNFITNHSTQRVLGVFVGGFVYSIVLLLLLEDNGPNTLYIVPSFAILFSIICLFVFVFFIHHVTTWIQVSNLIYNITQSTTARIEEYLEDRKSIHEDPPWDDWESEEIKHISPQKFFTTKTGYIQYIDIPGMVEQASKDDCILRIERNINDYVDEETPILSVWPSSNSKFEGNYDRFITVGTKQAPFHNIEFGMIKIVEIAVRALSPGINDPNTAINCIDNLGRILIKLTKKHLQKSYFNDQNRNLRVIFEQPTFSDYLYKSFSQIRQYGGQDITILKAIIRTLTVVAESSASTRKSIWEFSNYVIEGIHKDNLLSLDRKYLNRELKRLAVITEHSKDFKPL
ncbi:DUF2254 domain-containing protein [Fredinandcohnia sp. 179-A 10B2 NHS]|uniref:DUF2254 domain-containing protein n=1 Tax=Fredinandcohnia sp. 179-A 10B2 NHS TaxID=3235176 RepID=UPI00399FAB84